MTSIRPYGMTMPHHAPAQRHFVHQFIDWGRVECRLERYPAIRRTFPLKILKKYGERPPYYCHYMAWRLGTWSEEPLFQRLEELLCCAEALDHWEQEKKSLVNSPNFGEFWSLVWQLQVAEYLRTIGTEVCWTKSGPDLTVTIGKERWFVECYSYRKSFGLFLFLQEELLLKIDPSLRTSYDLCLPFRLPQESDQSLFLDTILSPLLDSTYLVTKKEEAEHQYPVILHEDPSSSLYVYVEGDDTDAYMPGIIPRRVGDPEAYLRVVLQEAVNAKRNSNRLAEHHPNLVATNYVLSVDYQLARNSPRTENSRRTFLESGPNIDVLTVSTAGINERLTREKLKIAGVNSSHQVNRVSLNRIAEISGS